MPCKSTSAWTLLTRFPHISAAVYRFFVDNAESVTFAAYRLAGRAAGGFGQDKELRIE